MAFIYVTIILDTLALGITIPVLPHLITNFVGDKAETAAIYGLLVTIWGLMQFLFSPLIGVLSDRFGRRPVLILSGFGLGLDYIIMALAQSLPWFFVGRILSGIMSSSFATAAAYVADVTPVERRAGAFGMVGAAWGIGFIAGPAIGGVLGTFGIRIPFWGAAAFSLASASYGLFVLPESLSKEHRQRLAWRRANPVGSLTLLRSHPTLFGLAAVTFVQFMAFQVLPTVFVLYAFDRFAWREFQVGLSLALVGALNITVQGGLVRRFITRFGERKALLTGLLFGSAAMVVWGLAPNDIVLLLAAFASARQNRGSCKVRTRASRVSREPLVRSSSGSCTRWPSDTAPSSTCSVSRFSSRRSSCSVLWVSRSASRASLPRSLIAACPSCFQTVVLPHR